MSVCVAYVSIAKWNLKREMSGGKNTNPIVILGFLAKVENVKEEKMPLKFMLQFVAIMSKQTGNLMKILLMVLINNKFLLTENSSLSRIILYRRQ